MLLALDTATTTASLAVLDLATDQLLAEITWEARRRQTEQLLVTATDLLATLDLQPGQKKLPSATFFSRPFEPQMMIPIMAPSSRRPSSPGGYASSWRARSSREPMSIPSGQAASAMRLDEPTTILRWS